jgi:hypothetical protein
MAGQSKKKEEALRSSNNLYYKIVIIIATLFYILCNAYGYFFKEDFEISNGKIFGFFVLTGINCALYYMLDFFMNSMFKTYLIDIFGLNIAVEILINLHWKFWYLYLIYPAYFLYWGGIHLYNYVKTIGKEDNSGVPGMPEGNQQEKPKKKIVKINK